MNRLIEAFRGLFTVASVSGGTVAETAKFALDNVDWASPLNELEPASNAMVDTYLEAAGASSAEQGSSAHTIAEALLAVADRLPWGAPYEDRAGELDMAAIA